MEIKRTKGEKSFSLVEILLALGLMALMLTNFYSAQSRISLRSNQARRVTQATWLAKSLMAQVEYQSTFLTPKEMKSTKKNQEFSEGLCPNKCRYRYNLTIQPWKLDLVSILFSQMGDEQASQNKEMIAEIKKQVKASLGSELLYYALAEVTWNEGIKKRSVAIPYLLTEQTELDNLVASFSLKKN